MLPSLIPLFGSGVNERSNSATCSSAISQNDPRRGLFFRPQELLVAILSWSFPQDLSTPHRARRMLPLVHGGRLHQWVTVWLYVAHPLTSAWCLTGAVCAAPLED